MREQTNPYQVPPYIFWHEPVAYHQDRKCVFHRATKQRLKALADHCGWSKATYDVRSIMGGIAVSGEVILHHDQVYICVSQELGRDCGILFRSCNGRQDYSGGTNSFAPLDLLDDIPALAGRIARLVLPSSAEVSHERRARPS